ncbi:MAG: flagellar hook-basal body complex protein [Pirellulaceae bacterium]
MSRALFTGITGLRAHQQKLDVVSNNLANMNTIGFKSQSTNFSNLVYHEVRGGSASSQTTGGINPQQIGSGVQVASISRNFSQGTLQSTGETLDFAIQGDGFFTVEGKSGEQLFSRAGSFTIDGEGHLVDPSTGFLVQRIGDLGEPASDGGVGFQIPGDSSITVPVGAAIPGEASQQMLFAGNLPSTALPPTAEVLSSFEPFETKTGVIADATTRMSDMKYNQIAYGVGDIIELEGTSPDGTPYSGTLAAENATLGDLVTELNNLLNGATAALQPNGRVTITADDTGEAFTSLLLRDAPGNSGSTSFSSNSMVVTTDGSDGDTYELSSEIFDSRGESHRVTFDLRKDTTNTWSVQASVNSSSGIMLDDSVYNLTFNEDGTYAVAGATGVGDTDIQVQFNSIGSPQTIELDFSSVKHLATDYSLSQTQNGFPPGNLVSVSVASNGELAGLATNGKTIPLAQLAIASFRNQAALDAVGGNYFSQSVSSGTPLIGEGLSSGRGQVIGGQLEGSNVDITQEFTQLIVAQRGFSANARTVTIAEEILRELTDLIR